MKHYKPKAYQTLAHDFLVDRLFTKAPPLGPAGGGLFLDPGLGKTSISLWTMETLKSLGELKRALIIAPLRVCYSVWPNEIKKWGCDLELSIVHGTAAQKLRALKSPTDIKVINPAGLPWLMNQPLDSLPNCDFDLLVLDESTQFKTHGTQRFKNLKKFIHRFNKRVILTGTPTPKNYGDLFTQIYALDDGHKLGKTVTYFRSQYMRQGGFRGREWEFDGSQKQSIEEAISPMVLRLSSEDHLDLPEKVDNVIKIQLPRTILSSYKKLERELFLKLEGGEELIASSAGSLYSMCKGIANGGAYMGDGKERQAVHVHDTKVRALKELIDELGGKPVLVAYQFNHDLERIRTAFPKAPVVKGGVKASESEAIFDKWNKGEVPVLLVQPQAVSHGVNLQAGGNDLVWFGLTDQMEIYMQLNARLWRQGVEGQVRIHHLIAEETVEEVMYERCMTKIEDQQSLLDSLNEYRKENEQQRTR